MLFSIKKDYDSIVELELCLVKKLWNMQCHTRITSFHVNNT